MRSPVTEPSSVFREEYEKLKSEKKVKGDEGRYFDENFFEDLNSYDIDSIVSKIDIPTLIFHGTQDDVVPFEHSKRFYHKLDTKRRFVEDKAHRNLCLVTPWWVLFTSRPMHQSSPYNRGFRGDGARSRRYLHSIRMYMAAQSAYHECHISPFCLIDRIYLKRIIGIRISQENPKNCGDRLKGRHARNMIRSFFLGFCFAAVPKSFTFLERS